MMLRTFQLFALMMLLGLSTAVLADQVTLKNGDRLTGTVVKSDGKTLVCCTPTGDVAVPVRRRSRIKTDAQLARHPQRRNGGGSR